jgi:hypothetical protein
LHITAIQYLEYHDNTFKSHQDDERHFFMVFVACLRKSARIVIRDRAHNVVEQIEVSAGNIYVISQDAKNKYTHEVQPLCPGDRMRVCVTFRCTYGFIEGERAVDKNKYNMPT